MCDQSILFILVCGIQIHPTPCSNTTYFLHLNTTFSSVMNALSTLPRSLQFEGSQPHPLIRLFPALMPKVFLFHLLSRLLDFVHNRLMHLFFISNYSQNPSSPTCNKPIFCPVFTSYAVSRPKILDLIMQSCHLPQHDIAAMT